MPSKVYNISVRVSEDTEWVMERMRKLAQLEHVSFSEVVKRALEEYVKRHGEGNPQKPLFPEQEPWENPMCERRRENLEWFESVIERNPGAKLHKIVAAFSKASGLKRETVLEYLRTLQMAGVVYERWGKLYHKNSWPAEQGTPP